MKFLTLSLLLLALLVAHSCRKASAETTRPERSSSSTFIAKEQANRMIRSYRLSIGYPQKDAEIRSWQIDASALRQYLEDTSIRDIRIILAHSQGYIDAGHEGTLTKPYDFALTPVLVGIGADGGYVYRDGKVLDNAAPCPEVCSAFDSGLDEVLY